MGWAHTRLRHSRINTIESGSDESTRHGNRRQGWTRDLRQAEDAG